METGEELVTKKLYQLYARDQEYQQTPFHSSLNMSNLL